MSHNITQYLSKLKQYSYTFDGAHLEKKQLALKAISKVEWKSEKHLINYHELLLFIAAHPETETILNLAEKELLRLSNFLKKTKAHRSNDLLDSGLPYTSMITSFSHDLFVWLQSQKDCTLTLDSFEESGTDLNTLLRMTLPLVEQEETSAGLGNEDLLDALLIKKKRRLSFLLEQFSELDATPIIKDHLWSSLKLFIKIDFNEVNFSKSYNRFTKRKSFFHEQILKKFDYITLIKQALPPPRKLSHNVKNELVSVIRKSLILTMRETDPSTFMDENSLRYYELERGIGIAIYGMKSNRQMAIQSYIGYTLFKNGFPTAYGGSWIFGRSAMFGLNIFETFRGGESGYVMCQLLRVYRQAFGIDYFEIEPYQYGKDNPDGIKSGAFWFYYKFGFKPTDEDLDKLAKAEHHKLRLNPALRTSTSTLHRFTESTIALQIDGNIPVKIMEVTSQMTHMFEKQFDSNRSAAIAYCIKQFIAKTEKIFEGIIVAKSSMEEAALLAEVMQISDIPRLQILLEMIALKPKDPYEYNKCLIKLFGS